MSSGLRVCNLLSKILPLLKFPEERFQCGGGHWTAEKKDWQANPILISGSMPVLNLALVCGQFGALDSLAKGRHGSGGFPVDFVVEKSRS